MRTNKDEAAKRQARLDELDALNRPLTVDEAEEFERLFAAKSLDSYADEEW